MRYLDEDLLAESQSEGWLVSSCSVLKGGKVCLFPSCRKVNVFRSVSIWLYIHHSATGVVHFCLFMLNKAKSETAFVFSHPHPPEPSNLVTEYYYSKNSQIEAPKVSKSLFTMKKMYSLAARNSTDWACYQARAERGLFTN